MQERELTEPAPRTFEDLQMYHQFFPELYELDVSFAPYSYEREIKREIKRENSGKS